MTRKEAIEIIKLNSPFMGGIEQQKLKEALDMSIHALELLTSYEHTIVKLMKIIKENEV